MSQARPIRPPVGYHVRPEGQQWRAVARYGTWHGTLRSSFLHALSDAVRRANIRAV